MVRYRQPVSTTAGSRLNRPSTKVGAARATARKLQVSTRAVIIAMPRTRRMPFRSRTPQYWDTNTDMPEHSPKPSRFASQPHWPAMPTADRVRSPSRETIMVSTSWKELVSTFWNAMGRASRAVTCQKGLSPR